jgi:hypothetical protein
VCIGKFLSLGLICANIDYTYVQMCINMKLCKFFFVQGVFFIIQYSPKNASFFLDYIGDKVQYAIAVKSRLD